jgi:hypothetical protein
LSPLSVVETCYYLHPQTSLNDSFFITYKLKEAIMPETPLLSIEEAIHGGVLGIVSAHPDDDLMQKNVIEAAKQAFPHLRIVEFAGTVGEGGINLLTDSPDFVINGQRETEGRAGATYLGAASYTQFNEGDGQLQDKLVRIVDLILDWAHKEEITTFLTPLGDHPDHQAVALATREATKKLGWMTQTLELLPTSKTEQDRTNDPEETIGTLIIDPSPACTIGALEVALRNPSQFEISRTPQEGWVEIHGLYLEPETRKRLSIYPIFGDAATYRVLRMNDN